MLVVPLTAENPYGASRTYWATDVDDKSVFAFGDGSRKWRVGHVRYVATFTVVLVAALVALGLGARDARASFHCMRACASRP